MKVTAGSAVEAIGPAFSHMTKVCFKPFNMGKWFVMGFCAFLATLGEGGGVLNNVQNLGRGGGGPGRLGGVAPVDVWAWISANMSWLLPVAIAGLIFLIGLWIEIIFLKARGTFMLLDNVVEDRAAVKEPWRKYREQGWSYFKFMLVMLGLGFATWILAGGVGALIALPNIRAREFGTPAIIGMVVGALLLIGLAIPLAIVSALVRNFVVPIMFLRETTFRPAWREARDNVFRGNVGPIVIFFLLKIPLGMGAAIVAMIAGCLTCCIGFLPYLNSVLLLPIHVFNQSFSLAFLERFDPAYRLLVGTEPQGFPVIPHAEAGYGWTVPGPTASPPPPPPPTPPTWPPSPKA